MKTKILFVSLIALLLVSLASAVSFSVSPTSLNFASGQTSSQFIITNTNSSALLDVNLPSQIQLTGVDGYIATFNIAPSGLITGINSSSPRTITVTPASSIDYSKFDFDNSYTSNIIISELTNQNNNKTVTLNVKNDFCSSGIIGNLIVDTDITNKGEYGEEDEWYPFEEIEVEVTIENNGDDDIDDVVVSWGVYNKRTGEFLIDDEEKGVDIKDDDEETVTFSFTIDPEDLDSADSESDYALYVKAYSDDLGEDKQCDYIKQDVKILRDDNFVLPAELSLPSEVTCSQTVESRLVVWNIGDSDEEDVYVMVTNKELGLNKRLEVGDLDIYEDKKLSFDFLIPNNATEKAYTIEFKVYDEDEDVFENDDGDEAKLSQSITVSGGCEVKKSVDLSTVLESEAIAGQEVTIKSTLRNSGTSQTSYQIIVTGYDSWATLQSVEPRTITLNGLESQDVTIKLIPNKDASGDKEFTVQALYSGLITEQKITVPITPKASFSLTGLSIGNLFGGNWFIWVIALLNVVLVVLIIVIAVRIARK